MAPVHPDMIAVADRWCQRGWVSPWKPSIAEFEAGEGRMVPPRSSCFAAFDGWNGLVEGLTQSLTVHCGTAIERVTHDADGWTLHGRDPLRPAGRFSALVLAVPGPEALALLRPVDDHAQAAPDVLDRIERVRWNASWVTSIDFAVARSLSFDIALIRDDPILERAVRVPLPGAEEAAYGTERWQLQARASWSNHFAHLPAAEAARWMQRAFLARTAAAMVPRTAAARLWRWAFPAKPLHVPFVWDRARTLGLCGDWLGGSSLESAFLSGTDLGRAIRQALVQGEGERNPIESQA